MLAVPVHNVGWTFGFGRQLQFLFLKFKRRSFMIASWSRGPHPIGLDHFFHTGAVAQLGERLICIQEVAGSIPTSSTILKLLWP